MKNEKMKSKIEIYICNYERPGEDSCFAKGAKELTDDLKKWAKEETQKGIKVVRGGCLGKCSEGIAIACYPQKEFILEVKKEDSLEIKKGLKEALGKL
jgi:NADH:ubiquinone oxidoreductase subunit E